MDILQCISRSLWKKRNPQICMNGGFYGQHSFWTAPFNLIRVQFGISRASDILFWGFLLFISREERGFNLYSETWQQLRPQSFLSLSLSSQRPTESRWICLHNFEIPHKRIKLRCLRETSTECKNFFFIEIAIDFPSPLPCLPYKARK